MKLFDELTENALIQAGWEITDTGMSGRPDYFKGCNWWTLGYKFLRYSVYYDPSDIMGSVGAPYYEFYDGDDTYRYLLDNSFEFISDVNEYIPKHNTDIETNPELFL